MGRPQQMVALAVAVVDMQEVKQVALVHPAKAIMAALAEAPVAVEAVVRVRLVILVKLHQTEMVVMESRLLLLVVA